MLKPLLSTLLVALVLLPSPSPAARSFRDYPALAALGRTTLRNHDGDRLDVVGYMSTEKRPALVVLPGSLCAPLFVALNKDPPPTGFTTAPLFSEKQGKDLGVHIIYLERRNMVSLETFSSAPAFSVEQVLRISPCTDRNGGSTLEQRVADVLLQLKWLKAQKWVSTIHLVGTSEGGDVAAGVAAAGAITDSIMLVGSAGPTQFFDFTAFARQQHDRKSLKSVFSELDQLLSGPTPGSYKGYSAKHWQSFAVANSSLDSLYKSRIPVFIAHGELDESVPVSSADLAAVELMVHQPQRAIYYWSVSRADHSLATPAGSRMWEAITQYVSWAISNPSGRKFRAD